MDKMTNAEFVKLFDGLTYFSGYKMGEAIFRLKAAGREIDELNRQVEFWMGEGDGTEWPPENQQWKILSNIPPPSRTKAQIKKMRQLQEIVWWKTDEKLQYERAESAGRDNIMKDEYIKALKQGNDRRDERIAELEELRETVELTCNPPNDCDDVKVLKTYMLACYAKAVKENQK